MQHIHETMNQSAQFADLDKGAHTQSIESMWNQVKHWNKWECGTYRFSRFLLVEVILQNIQKGRIW